MYLTHLHSLEECECRIWYPKVPRTWFTHRTVAEIWYLMSPYPMEMKNQSAVSRLEQKYCRRVFFLQSLYFNDRIYGHVDFMIPRIVIRRDEIFNPYVTKNWGYKRVLASTTNSSTSIFRIISTVRGGGYILANSCTFSFRTTPPGFYNSWSALIFNRDMSIGL